MRVHAVTLRFSDPAAEAAWRTDAFEKSLPVVIWVHIAGVLLATAAQDVLTATMIVGACSGLVMLHRMQDKLLAHRMMSQMILAGHVIGWSLTILGIASGHSNSGWSARGSTYDSALWSGHVVFVHCIAIPFETRLLIFSCIVAGTVSRHVASRGLLLFPLDGEAAQILLPFASSALLCHVVEYQMRLGHAHRLAAEERELQLERDLMAMVAHETRNPMNGVLGNLRLATSVLDELEGKLCGRDAAVGLQPRSLAANVVARRLRLWTRLDALIISTSPRQP